ncbi:MAG TPA: Rnase Y domain-containing protein, partial [Candidatus Cloacimonadota bacterium]|nr:Rnase Y domain-containing protein [Candidatus Cloacimonadota bacterium]
MNNPYILGVLGLVLGFVIALILYFIKRNSSFKLVSQADEIAENIKRDGKNEAETLKKEALLEAREEWFKQKRILDEEVKERQRELRAQEKKYNERLSSLDKR